MPEKKEPISELQIKLCDTLSEFCAIDDRFTGSTTRKIFASFCASSDFDLTPDIKQNTKYLVPEWRCAGQDTSFSKRDLILVPQRISWMCGRMPVLFYKGDALKEGIYSNLEESMRETFGVLDVQDRIEPIFFASLQQARASIESPEICHYVPSDDLANNLPIFGDPDDIYFLQTKRALALSDLPSPKSKIIEFGSDLLNSTSEDIDRITAETLKTIRDEKLPFVLKTNYCDGGRGTYLIRSLEDLNELLESVAQNLPRDLRKLDVGNVMLHPSDLILQEMLPSGKTYSINFYVYSDGRVQLLNCNIQHDLNNNQWSGATLIYSQQQQLAAHFHQIVQQAGSFLHLHGYRGPSGMDVMSDEDGKPVIVDLNTRPTGCFLLGCFRDHFVDTLEYDAATVLPFLEFRGDRSMFNEAFASELRSGKMIVVAWCTDTNTGWSTVGIVLGDKDSIGLVQKRESLIAWVQSRQT